MSHRESERKRQERDANKRLGRTEIRERDAHKMNRGRSRLTESGRSSRDQERKGTTDDWLI